MVREAGVLKGYKKTEVGVIPEEWEVKKLGEIFTCLRTGTSPRSGLADEGNIGYIHYGDIHSKWDTVLDCSIAQIPYIEEKKARSLPRLRSGDLVMVDASEDYAGLGKSVEVMNIGEQEIVAGLHTILLRGNKELVADGFKGFLQFMQPARESLHSIATGISVYGISKRNLQDISVALPPLQEQKAIAEVLSDVDKLIASMEKLIDKKQKIKQGTMQLLLTGKKRLPRFAGWSEVERSGDVGYKKTEVGVIPKEWEVKRLGDIFMFLRTGTNSRSELADEGNIGYIHYGDIHSKWDTVLDCSIAQIPYIEEKKARNLPRLRDGDLVMVDASEDYAGLGKSVEVMNIGEQEIVAGLHTILLRGNREFVADGFKGFFQFMRTVRGSLCSVATGISVYGISKRNLQYISVPLPPLTEQKAIAQILLDMDSEIEALEKKLNKYKLIKEGMMEELLTGKVRLV